VNTLPRRRWLQALGASLLTAPPACRAPRRDGSRTVVDLWFSYGGTNREVLLQLVSRFNRAQPRVTVRAVFQGDYFEALAKLRTALAAGVAPALSHVVGEVVPYLAGAGVLEALDGYEGARSLPLVRALAQSGSYLGGDRHPLVAIPFNRSTPVLYANARMLADAGLRAPDTWDALREAATRLTRRDGADVRWGYEVPISWWFWVAMVGQAGGSVLDTEGRATLGGEAGVKALRFWQELVHERRVMRPPPGRDYNAWQAANQDFLAGRAAMVMTSSAFLRYLERNASFPVTVAPVPSDVRAAVPTGGTFFVVLKQAPTAEREAAWRFLRWMCEADQTLYWATRTGYLPVATDAVARLESEGYYRSHPHDRVALDQLRDVQPWPWSPGLFRVQRDAVEPRLEEAVLTQRDARAVLDEARAAAREDAS